jgi:hypothetical protein
VKFEAEHPNRKHDCDEGKTADGHEFWEKRVGDKQRKKNGEASGV